MSKRPAAQARAREIHDSMARVTGDARPAPRHQAAARMLVATSSAASVTPGAPPLAAKVVADLLLNGLG